MKNINSEMENNLTRAITSHSLFKIDTYERESQLHERVENVRVAWNFNRKNEWKKVCEKNGNKSKNQMILFFNARITASDLEFT